MFVWFNGSMGTTKFIRAFMKFDILLRPVELFREKWDCSIIIETGEYFLVYFFGATEDKISIKSPRYKKF